MQWTREEKAGVEVDVCKRGSSLGGESFTATQLNATITEVTHIQEQVIFSSLCFYQQKANF